MLLNGSSTSSFNSSTLVHLLDVITAQDFAAKDHSLDAFTGIFFILSYGDSNDVILGVNGGTISVA